MDLRHVSGYNYIGTSARVGFLGMSFAKVRGAIFFVHRS